MALVAPLTVTVDLPELHPDERALLQRFRAEQSPDGAVTARVLAGVQSQLAFDGADTIVPLSRATSHGALAWLRFAGLSVAIAATTLLVIGGTTRLVARMGHDAGAPAQAVDQATQPDPQTATAPSPKTATAPGAAMQAPAITPSVDAPVLPASEPASLDELRSKPRVGAKPRTREGASAPAPIDAAAEIALVRDAKRERDATARLALIERHHREFASGALVQEIAVLEIQTLCALGRTQSASDRAAALLRRWPSSPYGAIARRVCDDGGRP